MLTYMPFSNRILLSSLNSLALSTCRVSMNFTELCRSMNIAEGPNEYVKPKNVGLLFFSLSPEHWFPYTRIDIVEMPDWEGGRYHRGTYIHRTSPPTAARSTPIFEEHGYFRQNNQTFPGRRGRTPLQLSVRGA